MKRFYVASSFKNIDLVRYVSKSLEKIGFIHTYDWTQNVSVTSIEQLRTIGMMEKTAVLESDFIVVVLPAGKGSHTELGIAIGSGKKVYIYSTNTDTDNLETTTTFYHLPEITKCNSTVENLVDIISKDNNLK